MKVSVLGFVNFVLCQWFGVRLAYFWTAPSGRHWFLIRWVWPLTGWRGGSYRWIGGRSYRTYTVHATSTVELTAVAIAGLMFGSGLGLALLCAGGAP